MPGPGRERENGPPPVPETVPQITFQNIRTAWARAYFQAGEAFDFSDHDENQRKAWEGMKAARRRLIAVAQRRAATDARRMLPLPRSPRQV